MFEVYGDVEKLRGLIEGGRHEAVSCFIFTPESAMPERMKDYCHLVSKTSRSEDDFAPFVRLSCSILCTTAASFPSGE